MKQLGLVNCCDYKNQSAPLSALIDCSSLCLSGKRTAFFLRWRAYVGTLPHTAIRAFKHAFFVLLLSVSFFHCAVAAVQKNTATNNKADKSPEIHLLVDVSGSMKKTDPQNLRVKAIKMFAYLIKQKASMGIQVFATKTEELLAPSQVTAQSQKILNKKMYQITSNGAWTDIDAALNAANQDWHSNNKVIILLTDGTLDLDSESLTKASRDKLTQSTISNLEQDGVRVFSIGFSNDADKQLLQEISLKTNGMSSVVTSADDLDTLLYQIFTAIVPANGAPLTSNKDTSRSIKIDKNIHELNLVFKKGTGMDKLYLSDPAHSKNTVLSLTSKDISTRNYSFVTIPNPTPGEWILSGPAQEIERALILTDINLISNFQSGVYFEGELLSLSAHLEDKGATITSALFLEQMMMIVNLNNKEEHYSYHLPSKADGLFKKKMSLNIAKGSYNVVILAKNEQFSREIQFIIDVYDAPFKTRLTASPSAVLELIHPELIKADSTTVQVLLDKKTHDLPVSTSLNSWEIDLKSLCDVLTQQSKLFLKVDTESVAGRSIAFKMPLALNFCPQPVLESAIVQIAQKKVQAPPPPPPPVVRKAPVVQPAKVQEQEAIVEAERSKFNYKIILYGIFILLLLVALFALIFTIGVRYGKKLNKIKKDLTEDLKEKSTDEKNNDE